MVRLLVCVIFYITLATLRRRPGGSQEGALGAPGLLTLALAWPLPGPGLALAWAVAWPWPGPGLALVWPWPGPGLGLALGQSFGLWRPVALLLWLGLWLPRRWGVWLGWLPDTHAKAKNVVDALALLSVTFARVRAAFRESLHTLVCVVVSVCVCVCVS